MAEPNDWGIFMAEEPLVTLGLEQSEGRRSEEGFRLKPESVNGARLIQVEEKLLMAIEGLHHVEVP